MAVSTVEREVAGMREACARAEDGLGLFAELAERLRKVVPFDGSGWFGTDPATVLATSPVRVENIEDGHCDSYWVREARVEDALLYRDLARSQDGAATLYAATDGTPARSARYREFLAPQGYGDELRAVARVGGSTWGVLDLYRERSRRDFSEEEVAIVRAVLPAMGAALRGIARATSGAAATTEGPGTALFVGDTTLLSLDDAAAALFVELAGADWARMPLPMTPIYAAVARASAVAEGRDRGPATVRMRTAAGRWLIARASCLRSRDGRLGPTALTIEPAKSSEIAPIIVEAYGLTAREQQITRSVARGLSNLEIAAELFLSPHTVRDHLKAIFAKVGVGSRGELVAKLFAEHYGPALHAEGAAVDHVQVA